MRRRTNNILIALMAVAALVVPRVAEGQNTTPASTSLGSYRDRTGLDRPLTGVVIMDQNGLPSSGGSTGGGGSSVDPRVAQGTSTTSQPGQLIQCAVVSGDQAFTAGTINPVTCTTTGRVKVGVSSATNVEPAAQPATTLAADLVACKYRAAVSWTINWTGSISCDAQGQLLVGSSTLATAAGQATIEGNITATQAPTGTLAATSDTVTEALLQVTGTDRGAVVGTTPVQLMAANTARRGWSVQNQSATTTCYVGTTTDYHSLMVGPGVFYEPDHHVATNAISMTCTAAGTPIYSREW